MKPEPRKSPAVLVVGAGPTGLTLATVLARYGVQVRLIERKPRLSQHSKATNLMQRSQEYLYALGLVEPIELLSGHMRRIMVHAYGKCLGPRTMHLPESPFPDVLLCGQHNFEEVVARGFFDAGGKIEFDTELTNLNQGPDGCSVSLVRHGTGEKAHFSHVIGCDGQAGMTRSFTKLDFKTRRTGVGIRQVDCRLTWHRLPSMDQMWLFYFDQGFAAVVPLPDGIHRILFVEPKTRFPEREPTLPEMQAKLREVVEDPSLRLENPEWFSYTDLFMGHAPALRDKRVFLAGDAGNPVLPNGGQGMNTGIADALNLGWKPAAVLNHGGPNSLLDTYNEERHALRLALEKTQWNSLRYTTLVTPKLAQAAFRIFAEPALNHGGESKMAKAFSELLIDTRRSSLSLDSGSTKRVRTGDRALDAHVTDGSQSIRLYSLIYRGGWTLFAFSGCAAQVNIRGTLTALGAIDARVSTYVVSTASLVEQTTGTEWSVLYDLDEEAHRIYGLTASRLILIRPDGHIAVRVTLQEASSLNVFLRNWLPDPSQAFSQPLARQSAMQAFPSP